MRKIRKQQVPQMVLSIKIDEADFERLNQAIADAIATGKLPISANRSAFVRRAISRLLEAMLSPQFKWEELDD